MSTVPAPDASAPSGEGRLPPVDFGPYRTTTERPEHLANWQLPQAWSWGASGVWIGHNRHTQHVVDPLGRSLSLVTAPAPEHSAWLLAEARALGNRRHRAIPTTYVFWPRNDNVPRGPGYARHWIDGTSLAMQLHLQNADSVQTAMTRLRSIGSCLAMLHDRGETHGALNSIGSWVSRTGEHFLLGWQWALPPESLPLGMSPSLEWTVAAPEWLPAIATGSPWWAPTPQTDQFQLAALTVCALAGKPWAGSASDALLLLEGRDDVPRSVRVLLRRAMAHDPGERFPSVAALLHTLDRSIGGDSSLAGIALTPSGVAHAEMPEHASPDAAQEARLRMVTGLDYDLIERLGSGMVGDVWRARDLALNREVALKALRPEIAQDAAAVSRLRREARLVASLAHPRIVPVLEFAERGGIAYFTMAFTPGGSLENLIVKEGPLPLDVVGPQIDALLDGIATAHLAGIVHRDVKPENILLDRYGNWCLADFGIAGAPGERGAMGTLAFAAPEQLRGEPQDERVDRYAIAAVVFYALTGHLPFVSHHPRRQVDRQAAGVDWSASWAARIPETVQAWLACALAFNPEDRFDSTAAMREAWELAYNPPASDAPNASAAAAASPGGGARKSWGELSSAWRRLFDGIGKES